MAHSTHRNQKMKRTPEDWTPRNLSYWIRNVASSWAESEEVGWRGGGGFGGVGGVYHRDSERLSYIHRDRIAEAMRGKRVSLSGWSKRLRLLCQFFRLPSDLAHPSERRIPQVLCSTLAHSVCAVVLFGSVECAAYTGRSSWAIKHSNKNILLSHVFAVREQFLLLCVMKKWIF